MAAGFDPAAFWSQTPRLYGAAMAGAGKRIQREAELALTTAWLTIRFERTKKLKPLAKYLAEIRPKRPQTPADMLAVLRGLQAAGAPMTIRKREG